MVDCMCVIANTLFQAQGLAQQARKADQTELRGHCALQRLCCLVKSDILALLWLHSNVTVICTKRLLNWLAGYTKLQNVGVDCIRGPETYV